MFPPDRTVLALPTPSARAVRLHRDGGSAIDSDQHHQPAQEQPDDVARRPPPELGFAAAIKRARIAAGRTQADVAAKAGLPLWLLSHAERGRRALKVHEAAAIAEALVCSLDELVKASAQTTFEPPQMGPTPKRD